MSANRVIIDASRKVVRAINIDSRRRDMDASELSAAIIAVDAYRHLRGVDDLAANCFRDFIFKTFRWNKLIESNLRLLNLESFLKTETNFILATAAQEKIKINE